MINSYMYVGPTSTQQEKNLQFRAKLLGNQPGYLTNDVPISQPATSIMDKIIKSQKAQKAKPISRELFEDSDKAVKFEMRDKLQLTL